MSGGKDRPDSPLFRTEIDPTKRASVIDPDEVIKKDKISYFWKTFDVKGQTLNQMVNNHPYVTEPEKSIGYEFFMFHLVSVRLIYS